MIKTDHGIVRTTDVDDARFLHTLYDQRFPRAALLDSRRESILPTVSELRELLGRKDILQGVSYTVEDTAGDIQAFCSLRGMNQESRFAELTLVAHDERFFDSALAVECCTFVMGRAFGNLHLHKLLAHSLCTEQGWRGLLARLGFASSGCLRQVFYARGGWHDIEVHTCLAPVVTAGVPS